ncbi:hypothetical protein C8A01DRAFT_32675 [Parachaetomium inaequale]|uniref:Pheromone receptor n=1 Tax=Parachaetomium inaequale TaxID=2588326 RepID=A0AAN6PNB3_9PEZI|nr:hypothetical protein C8A01DRAFT_32675 [Parachaetomium inaequale]
MASTNSTLPPNRWAVYGFTTTPEERIGPGAPYASPALQANLFFRVFLGIVSLFVTWVPARLLWRNGEFGGTVFCIMLLVLNLITVVNALIWRNNNVQTWWAGHGWCDIQTYTFFALHTAFNICMFEIMRSLASKVALNRTIKPTRSERRRQHIVSALIIFTVPVIQVILTYFSTVSRYNVSTLVGCSAVYYPNWIYLVFYIIPTPVFAVLAAYMAGLTFYRYRKIEKVTREVALSQDGVAAARQDRVRKKLYFMTLACIIVVLPLVLVLLFRNIVEGAPWNLPYDFDALHFGPDPFNAYFISFTTTNMMSFTSLNIAFIAEVAGIAVFIPFGITPVALNMYREMLLAVGLGYLFPKLKQDSSISTRKDSLLPTAEQVSLASRSGTGRAHSSSMTQQHQPKDFTMCGVDPLPYPEKTVSASSTTNHNNPWLDLTATELDNATAQIEAGSPPLSRNPYTTILPTPFAKPPPKFPALHIPSLHTLPTPAPSTSTHHTQSSIPWSASPHPAAAITPLVGVDTRVWADENPSSSRRMRIGGTAAADLESGLGSREGGRARGVVVETSIARQSMDLQDADGGDLDGEYRVGVVGCGRRDSTAAS